MAEYLRKAPRMRKASVKVATALLLVLMAMTWSDVEGKPVTTKNKPNLTYAAGPSQLTLIMSAPGAVRFAYHTPDQFRAERRFANGTVVGYYGFIGADGKAIRVSYGDTDQLGFQSSLEVIPDEFPAVTTDANPSSSQLAEEIINTTPSAQQAGEPSAVEKTLQEQWPSVIIDDEKESISVDAADYINEIRSRSKSSDSESTVFSFPHIHLAEFANKQRQSRAGGSTLMTAVDQQLQDAIPIVAPSEPAIILTDPSQFSRLTAKSRFSVSN